MKKCDNYSIGLDIGTGSVGWAAIDGDYNLCRFKGKDMWGAFIFDDAKTAAERRVFRAQRRRIDRRKKRIRYLQEIMSDMVLAKDESFFIRLQQSNLRSDLSGTYYKRNNYYNLFEGGFTDKDFYNKFPTIYHLRDYLSNSQEKADIRLVYLALHHIIKYRGNFLYEGKKIGSSGNLMSDSFDGLFLQLQSFKIESNMLYKKAEIIDVLKDKTLSKTQKNDKLKVIFSEKEYKKNYQAIISLILGNTAKLSDVLFLQEDLLNGDDKPLKISFADDEYDSNEESYLALAEERGDLLLFVKAIYHATLFEGITRGESSISKGMIRTYKKHEADLKIFKELVRLGKNEVPLQIEKNGKAYTIYDQMFRREDGANYVNYIGSVSNGCTMKKRVSKADFYDSVEELLKKLSESENKKYCLDEIKKNDFLPLINSVENASIPYQMHLKELEQIIDNQGKFYPELAKNKDKIVAVMTFKRPYYVGPLKGEYSWCTQNIKEKITPWNFYDIVDTEQLADKFIERMTNYCNVFKDEKVLPLKSIIYQAYTTLNEINKIKYKDKTICTEWKQYIFKELCCEQKTVKKKNIVAKLKNYTKKDIRESDITGLADEKLNSSMSTLLQFKSKLKSFDLSRLSEYEEAIRILTIFNDEKIKKSRLKNLKVFSDNERERDSLSKLQLTGWGRYSEKLLNGIKGKDGKTIVQTMYDTDKNINELLFDQSFEFAKQITNNEETIEYFDYMRDIQPLYCSPSVKKAIWNSLKIVEEIAKIAKCSPARIFLEDTHDTKEKVKTDSRVAHLSELYKSIENDEYFSTDCNKLLAQYKSDNKKLDSDKLYLWLIQLGRCMYTCEPISLDQLPDCEIDHIVPRSYIKDDSFENRVLVQKIENQNKTDTLSISPIIKERMKKFWKFLYEHKLIGNKKILNLTRGEYTEDDTKDFINRQLVETSQIIKEVRKILEKRYPKAEIMGIRAGMNSVMRYKYSRQNKAGFYKIRSLNHFHHAKDAYLTAVIGQFTTVACPFWGQNKLNKQLKHYIVNNDKSKYDVKTLVNKRYGIVIDLLENVDMSNFMTDENGEYLWDNDKFLNIFRTMEKNNCLIVKKQSYFANSDFYNQTIYGPKSGLKKLLPLKSKAGEDMPTEVYGGYSEEHPAYFAIVKYQKVSKKKTETKFALSQIPLQKVVQNENDKNCVKNYIVQKFGEQVEIVKIVHKFQLLKLNGHLCYLTGEGEVNNAVELFVDSKFEALLYQIENKKTKELYANEEGTSQLIKEFIIHYSKKIRRNMPLYDSFATRLDDILVNCYDSLTMDEKISLVKNMLIVSDTGAGRVTLDKKLQGGEFGRLKKAIYPDEVEWINNSRTGVYSSICKYSENK